MQQKHDSLTGLQKQPPYHMIYSNPAPPFRPSAPPIQQSAGHHGFQPYSPHYDQGYMHQHGHNPLHQQQFYPNGMQWNQYSSGTPNTGGPSQFQLPQVPQQQGQWGLHLYHGNQMHSPYGPYQGQGHPYGFDPNQQVQHFVHLGNPSFNPEQTENIKPSEAQLSSPNAEYVEEEIHDQQEKTDEDSDEGKLEGMSN